MDARAATAIRIDAMWLATEPVDMHAEPDRLLALVLAMFGAAQAHHGYVFAKAPRHAPQAAHQRRLRYLVRDPPASSRSIPLDGADD